MTGWRRDVQAYRPWGLAHLGFLAIGTGLLGVIEGGILLSAAGLAGSVLGALAIVSAVRMRRQQQNAS